MWPLLLSRFITLASAHGFDQPGWSTCPSTAKKVPKSFSTRDYQGRYNSITFLSVCSDCHQRQVISLDVPLIWPRIAIAFLLKVSISTKALWSPTAAQGLCCPVIAQFPYKYGTNSLWSLTRPPPHICMVESSLNQYVIAQLLRLPQLYTGSIPHMQIHLFDLNDSLEQRSSESHF